MQRRMRITAASLWVELMTTVTVLSCLFMVFGAYSQENSVAATGEGQAKIRILFLAANPPGTNELQLRKELREITEMIQSAKYRDVLEFVSDWAIRPVDLIGLLHQHNPQIVHLSGHGTTTGEIVLEDSTGTPQPVSTDAMRALFKTLKGNIRLVVLNACYSSTQALAIVENIDCAVGMSTEMENTPAMVFAASFYRALGWGGSVKQAFDEGKTALLLASMPGAQTPELFCRNGIDASQIFIIPEIRRVIPDAYGLTFNKIVWKHHYRGNGDFKGEVEYYVKNSSKDSIVILPPHQATWFGSNLQQPKIRAQIYGEERNAYSINQTHFSEFQDIRPDIDGRKREVTSYLWGFNISPSLVPQKPLHYGVIVETKGTELEAFTADGSFAAMGSPYPVAEMSCEVYAPEGYKFKKETWFVRDRAGNLKDFVGMSKPEFRDDDTKVIWSVEKPTPNLQYLIKVVIVKAN